MNAPKVKLIVATEDIPEREYDFEEPAQCVIGRADDCDIRLPKDFQHCDVSRHHCVLEIEPPMMRIRDLGSRNGTYVNGRKIGQRLGFEEADYADLREFADIPLQDGDEITVGHTVFRVGIEAPVDTWADVSAYGNGQDDSDRYGIFSAGSAAR